MTDDPFPNINPRRCAVCGEVASYGFGTPGNPAVDTDAWYCGEHRTKASSSGRRGTGAAVGQGRAARCSKATARRLLGSRPEARHLTISPCRASPCPQRRCRPRYRASVPLQIVSPCAEPPEGDGWLDKIKHDGHRLLAIVAGGQLRLISRSGYDRTELFRLPLEKLRVAGLPPLVLDGEIAVPDEKGVTHIDALSTALRLRRYDRTRLFRLRSPPPRRPRPRCCAIEDRKALLRDLVGAAGCEHIVFVDYIAGKGTALFAAVRQVGAEGIVSKRAGSRYGAGTSRDWLKTKAGETGAFL